MLWDSSVWYIINLKIIEFYKLLHLFIHFLSLAMDYEDIIKL